MSYLIVLRRVRVENANCVAGLTYGFPAITHFLGYTHALSRRLQITHGLSLDGCAVISHHFQHHMYSSGWDNQFALTRNPLTKEAKTAAFNEEGRMHMTVSLLIECHGSIPNGDEGLQALSQHLQTQCQTLRLAGGIITKIEKVDVMTYPLSADALRRLICQHLPSFALQDRSALLVEHLADLRTSRPEAQMLDAWLDFAALKRGAVKEPESGKVDWRYLMKPAKGYLVPLLTGYQRISPLYEPGEVNNTRDAETPFCFAEAVYGVGEWRGLHHIHDLSDLLWRYRVTEEGYYCCGSQTATLIQPDESADEIEEIIY